MEKQCYILLNGIPPSNNLLNSLNLSEELFICTDGAFAKIDNNNRRKVDILLGDFDSLDLKSISLSKGVLVKEFPTEKDYTDGYLAVIEAKNQNATNITILGACGGRIDHEYNNYTLLAVAKSLNMSAQILTDDTSVFLVDDKISLKTFIGSVISIVPFGDMVHILYTNGLKYPATDLVMDKTDRCLNSVMGISNTAIETNVQIVLKGKALVFVQREVV